MSTGNNIKKYTAADIENYHRGLLSSKERNDLEKAALEDPFLADAIEGYTTEGVPIKEDLADLKKRLHEKLVGPKEIPEIPKRSQPFPILRIAAILILLLGSGLLVYKFGFNRPKQEIAKAEPIKNNNEAAKDSADNKTTSTQPKVINSTNESAAIPGEESDSYRIKKENGSTGIAADQHAELYSTNPGKVDDSKADKTNKSPSLEPAAPVVLEKNEQAISSDMQAKNYETADGKKEMQVKSVAGNDKQGSGILKTKELSNARLYNVFQGRITDSANIGIPFANVMNIDDKVATYSDANGYFNLTNPDSILNVQVRSIGFLNDTVTLQYTIASNKIIMKEDKKTISPYVINKGQTQPPKRNRDASQVFEEPEPADGWVNYDAYMLNNLKIPDEFEKKSLPHSTVKVSFEVNSLGMPVNFRIEKSLCAACDKEAIRLIKDGPKWKPNSQKKGRTTVAINF